MKKILIKKHKLILIAVTAVALLFGVLVTYLVKMNEKQTISGDWEMVLNPEITNSTLDEVNGSQKVYYSFSKPGKYGDGEYKTIFDGGIEAGEYKLSEKKSKSYINMGTVDLEYKIEGSELTMTYPESFDEQTGEKIPAEDYVFTRTKAPEYENESYESFETDESLIAEWITEERILSYYTVELSYTETVEFMENGIMIIKYYSEELLLDRYMYYAYTVKDSTLLFSPVTDKETKYKIFYMLDKDGNLKFENDETTSSIFSDAFFSDVTYYHKEKDNK
ncbi:MAG: hypothetical protein K2K06_07670 [Oscillospiraceae bacterium]|nr:hypothetical protein [Oscillospiraceae bacterium]